MSRYPHKVIQNLIRRIKDFLWEYSIGRSVSIIKNIIKNCTYCWKGYRIAGNICDSGTAETYYFVTDQHIGDLFRHLKWMRPLKMYYGDEKRTLEFEDGCKIPVSGCIKKTVIVTTYVGAAVAGLYEDIDDIVVLDTKEMKYLYAYLNFQFRVHFNLYTLNEGSWIGTFKSWFESSFLERQYGFNGTQYALGLPKEYENEVGNPQIKNEIKQKMMSYANENHIRLKKTVILFPYSQSSDELSVEFWKRIVECLGGGITYLQIVRLMRARYQGQRNSIS